MFNVIAWFFSKKNPKSPNPRRLIRRRRRLTMADPRPFTNVDPATADAARRRGRDPYELDEATEDMLTYIYSLLPRRPVSSKGRLTAFVAASEGIDRISGLPDELLRTIVYRLPAKDAARTTVLSSHWRMLWLSTPLILSDTHLLPEGHGWPPTPANSPAVTAAVSHILEAHPGPFHRVHLVCSHMNAYRAQLARWLQLLAAKGVKDLVLVNRPWPRAVPLPATLFSITTLTRLYVGVWKLPDTAALRGASFPHLRELGICCVLMENGDVDSLVSRSPVLEILNIQGCMKALRLRLASQSLRCVQIGGSNTENITVVDAPRLERLIFYGPWNFGGLLCTSVRIGDAPKLHTFGFLDPKKHVLEIRDTMITAGIKVSRMTMVTSVKILKLHVRFGVHSDIKIVPTFLRCFPNVEILHITSGKCDQSTGDHGLKSWDDFGPIKGVLSRIRMLTFCEFRGEQSEVGFLELFFQSTRALKTAVIVLADPSFTPFSVDEALSKVKECSKKIASKSHQVLVCEGEGPEGAEPWTFQTGADFSCQDPFSLVVAVS